MKVTATVTRGAARPGVFILIVTIIFAGCASYSQSGVRPSDAATVLRIGDEVEITRMDGTTAYLKVEEVNDSGISGSLLTNAFGRNVTIDYDDMASITRYTKNGVDSQQTAEVLGGILGLALFLSLL